jgi:hypothetical protein
MFPLTTDALGWIIGGLLTLSLVLMHDPHGLDFRARDTQLARRAIIAADRARTRRLLVGGRRG